MTRPARRPRPPRRPGVRRRPHPHLGRRRRRLPGRPATPAAGQGGTARRPRRRRSSATPTALEHRQPGGRPVEDGDALVVATSGSTGEPKGVVLTHDAVAASAGCDERPARRHARRPLARLPAALPRRRARRRHPGAVDGHRGSRCSPASTRRPCSRRRRTLVSLVATALRRIDPTRFRRIVLGGAAPPDDLPANVVDHLRDDRDRQRGRLRRRAARRRRGPPRRRRRDPRARPDAAACLSQSRRRRRSPQPAAGWRPATSAAGSPMDASPSTVAAAT